MDPSYVSPMELLMSLNRRMSDCDKLIDPFCGNTSGANNRKCCTVGSHKVIDV